MGLFYYFGDVFHDSIKNCTDTYNCRWVCIIYMCHIYSYKYYNIYIYLESESAYTPSERQAQRDRQTEAGVVNSGKVKELSNQLNNYSLCESPFWTKAAVIRVTIHLSRVQTWHNPTHSLCSETQTRWPSQHLLSSESQIIHHKLDIIRAS